MIVTRSMHPQYLSNSYLVGDSPGGSAVIVDAGAPIEPLLKAATEHAFSVTHVFNTHDHHDHTIHNVELQERFDIPLVRAEDMADGQVVTSGGLTIRALSTPGHTQSHVALVANDQACFTGDVLFAGSVGGTLAGGPDGFEQLRHSIMDVVLKLDPATRLYPGHTDETTVAKEWESNPFVRVWRGLDSEADEPIRVAGRDATLVLWAGDYDGGNKAWVRFAGGGEAIVGGSSVERVGAPA